MERRRVLAWGQVLCLQRAGFAVRERRLETPGSARLHRDAGGVPLKSNARVSYSRPWSVSRQLRRHPKRISAIADLAFWVDPGACDSPTNQGALQIS
jgi:hypothetical protein